MLLDNDKPIAVVGSLNMDLVMRLPRLPVGGETLTGHHFSTLPGGKGANQAVACARLGGKVRMVGQVGDDDFGKALVDGLLADGVEVSGISRCSAVGTGVAMILVEDVGQNRIVLAPGANGALAESDIERFAPDIVNAAMLVVQLEVPLCVVSRAVDIAYEAGVPVLLNPAPAKLLPANLWSKVDFLVPNESEASLLADCPVVDVDSAFSAAETMRRRGARRVLITLGEQGVVIVDDQGARHLPAEKARVVDTTAAGDTFIGGLVVGLCEGLSLDNAAAFGQRASALSVTRYGAQPSIPFRREIL